MSVFSDCSVCVSFFSVLCMLDCSGEFCCSVVLVVEKVCFVVDSVLCVFGVICVLSCLNSLLVFVSVLFRFVLIWLNGILLSFFVMLVICSCNLLSVFGMVGSLSGRWFVLIFMVGVFGKKLSVMYSWFVSRLLVCNWLCSLCWMSCLMILWCVGLFLFLIVLWKWWLRCFGYMLIVIGIRKFFVFGLKLMLMFVILLSMMLWKLIGVLMVSLCSDWLKFIMICSGWLFGLCIVLFLLELRWNVVLFGVVVLLFWFGGVWNVMLLRIIVVSDCVFSFRLFELSCRLMLFVCY